MGLIAERWNERFDRGAWIADEDMMEGPVSKAGVRVSRSSALSLTAVFRCWDLLSSAVAQSPRDVFVKVGGKSFPEFSPPKWVIRPNGDPTLTGNDYFSQVALSLLADGNFFTLVLPHILDPDAELYSLDPARVTVKDGPIYEIKNDAGQVTRTVGPAQMLHGTWLRLPGARRGISPLEAMRTAYGAALATQESAARFFGQGSTLAFGVEVPGKMDQEKLDSLRANMKRKYAGLNNSHAIGVLTDGAKFVPNLAPTPEQAQFLDTRKFGVEEVCRIHGVPPGMAGSQEPGASSYASAYVNDRQFAERGVLPLAVRIEAQHDRLLQLPAGLDQGSVHFKFNLDSIARMNLLDRYNSYEIGVRAGVLKPDEARAYEDKSPVPGGDQLYMLQQMVPIQDLGKTKATEPLNTQTGPAGSQQKVA